jgi:N-acetylneuraminic acid mutarotase
MLTDRNFFPVVHFSRKLYVLGGYEAQSKAQLRTCEYFDLERHLWVKIASMAVERSMAAAVKINPDELLVFGGYNRDTGTLDSIESYCLSKDTWSLTKLRLPIPLRRCVAVRLSPNVCLIMGGLTRHSKESQRVFRLDYARREWMELENLEKGGVIESEVLTDGEGNLHLFLETGNGTSPHAHILYRFEQTQRLYETNNDL